MFLTALPPESTAFSSSCETSRRIVSVTQASRFDSEGIRLVLFDILSNSSGSKMPSGGERNYEVIPTDYG